MKVKGERAGGQENVALLRSEIRATPLMMHLNQDCSQTSNFGKSRNFFHQNINHQGRLDPILLYFPTSNNIFSDDHLHGLIKRLDITPLNIPFFFLYLKLVQSVATLELNKAN